MAKVKYCRDCSKELPPQTIGRTQLYCGTRCKNSFHNNRRIEGLETLKAKYPKIYQELFECSPA